jgi:hypothetical protein
VNLITLPIQCIHLDSRDFVPDRGAIGFIAKLQFGFALRALIFGAKHLLFKALIR